jgi:hypothetical protein
MDSKRLMLKNSDSDNDTKARLTRSGREFREFHLANLFDKTTETRVSIVEKRQI